MCPNLHSVLNRTLTIGRLMCNNIDTLQSLKTMDFYNYSCYCCYYFGRISKASKHSFIFFHKKFRSKYFRVPMVNQGVQDPHALFLKALWFKTGPSCPVASWMSSNGPLCSNMLFPLMDKKNQKSWAKIKLPSGNCVVSVGYFTTEMRKVASTLAVEEESFETIPCNSAWNSARDRSRIQTQTLS